jgi:hypothetical protein
MHVCFAHLLARATVRGRRGIATIEFGMVMAAIVVIVLGTYDTGNYLLQQMKLSEADRLDQRRHCHGPVDDLHLREFGDRRRTDLLHDLPDRSNRALRLGHPTAELFAVAGQEPDLNQCHLCRTHPIGRRDNVGGGRSAVPV